MSYYDVMRTSQQQHQRTTPPADQRPRVRLADDQWKDLEDKARMLWKSISAPNKAIILRYSTMQHPDAQTTQQVHLITSQCLEPDAAEFMVSRAASYHLGEQPFPKDTHTMAGDATSDASTMTGSVNRTNLKTGDLAETNQLTLIQKRRKYHRTHKQRSVFRNHHLGATSSSTLRSRNRP
jgi:hypothetical protein